MKALALAAALHLAGQTPPSACEVSPARCEEVIRKQSVAIDTLSLRLDETEALLRLEKTTTSSLTRAAKAPRVVVQNESPWWVYVIAIAGSVALGVGTGLALSK